MRLLVITQDIELRRKIEAQLGPFFLLEFSDHSSQIAPLTYVSFLAVIVDELSQTEVIRNQDSMIPIIFFGTPATFTENILIHKLGLEWIFSFPLNWLAVRARLHWLEYSHFLRANRFQIVEFQDLRLDFQTRKLRSVSGECELSTKEILLLRRLLHSAPHLCTHRELLQAAWGNWWQKDSDTLHTYVMRLRKKIHTLSKEAQIRNVYGVGYRIQ